MMTKVKALVFNLFQTNTYIISDDSKECIIIDAACSGKSEEKQLSDYIESMGLHPVRQVFTHSHLDHILGNNFIQKAYGIEPEIHHDGLMFWESAEEYASVFGVTFEKPELPKKFLQEGDAVTFGKSSLKVLETPGHARGSICFHNNEDSYIITGDVIFYGSIGRTDLPTGDYDQLISSIKKTIFTLKDDTTIYSGHGQSTSVGFEKVNNPFVNVMS